MKKQSAILFMVSQDYIFALATMIANLKLTNNKFYDELVVYYDEMTDEQKNGLLNIELKIKFVHYPYKQWEIEHKILDTTEAKNFIKRYTHLALSKYKIYEELEFYNKVLYLDLDMVIQSNIKELFEIKGVAWRNGRRFINKFGNKRKQFPEFDNIPDKFPAPNGGLLYVSDDIDWQVAAQDSKDFILKFVDYFAAAIDELAIAWPVFKNNLPLTSLDEKIYNTLIPLCESNTKIVHFMGMDKPWESEFMQSLFPMWTDSYREAYKHFDIDKQNKFKVLLNSPGKLYRKKLNEQKWLDFLKNNNIDIPNNLSLTFDLSNEWLILHCKNQPQNYVEFKFEQYTTNYSIGYWIRDSFWIEDKLLRKEIEMLLDRNKIFNIKEDNRGIYLYTTNFKQEKIKEVFNYFYACIKQLTCFKS